MHGGHNSHSRFKLRNSYSTDPARCDSETIIQYTYNPIIFVHRRGVVLIIRNTIRRTKTGPWAISSVQPPASSSKQLTPIMTDIFNIQISSNYSRPFTSTLTRHSLFNSWTSIRTGRSVWKNSRINASWSRVQLSSSETNLAVNQVKRWPSMTINACVNIW